MCQRIICVQISVVSTLRHLRLLLGMLPLIKRVISLSNIRPYFRKTWLATHSGGCNADVLCIRANPDKCLPKYLYYLFTTDNFVNDYLKSCKGAKMPRGDVQRLLDYEFDLPDLPTQLRIAGVMGLGHNRFYFRLNHDSPLPFLTTIVLWLSARSLATCLPFLVMRYFWRRLRGLSGIVSSINLSSKSAFKQRARFP